MKEIKYIADSILGGITIDDDLIYELYKTKELKRLSRVNHLGIVHFLYPMAMHFRFEHSLGVYELTRRAIHNLEKNGGEIDLLTKRTVMAAGLLHDLGHGPFSHLFEDVSPIHHEEYSTQIIADPNTEVYKAFEKIEPAAREGVIQILNGEHPIQ
jgi:HD superfamily phosphohydrolase